MTTNFSQIAAYIWSLADLLRGDFKQSQYGHIILPFTLLRRLECVLEATKPAVLAQLPRVEAMPHLTPKSREEFLTRAAGQSFYNSSPMNLSKLGSTDIKANLLTYIQSFSADAREIFEHFKFAEFVSQLDEANLLFRVVQTRFLSRNRSGSVGATGRSPLQRSPLPYADIPGFCQAASLDEVRANNYVLMPGRYVGTKEVEDDGVLFADKMNALTKKLAEQFARGDQLQKTIRENLKGIGYEF
jgi:type I restriction-modification system DNA methylase subunit